MCRIVCGIAALISQPVWYPKEMYCCSAIFLLDFEFSVGIVQCLGPVVRTPVSANPGLNFNPGFYIFLIKSTFSDNFFDSF